MLWLSVQCQLNLPYVQFLTKITVWHSLLGKEAHGDQGLGPGEGWRGLLRRPQVPGLGQPGWSLGTAVAGLRPWGLVSQDKGEHRW